MTGPEEAPAVPIRSNERDVAEALAWFRENSDADVLDLIAWSPAAEEHTATIVRAALARDEQAARPAAGDATTAGPSCPDHGSGQHVTGQAFGAGREWFCTLCDDTFFWVWAAGPRAGDTTPDDEPPRARNVPTDARAALVADLMRGMRNHSSGKSPDLAEHLADVLTREGAYPARVQAVLDDYRTRLLLANAELDRLRSDAAALRAAGDALAEAVETLTDQPETWTAGQWYDARDRAVAWRSAAEAATTTGDDR